MNDEGVLNRERNCSFSCKQPTVLLCNIDSFIHSFSIPSRTSSTISRTRLLVIAAERASVVSGNETSVQS
jgi:hypothetical protein